LEKEIFGSFYTTIIFIFHEIFPVLALFPLEL
jgi:hypothetical protein